VKSFSISCLGLGLLLGASPLSGCSSASDSPGNNAAGQTAAGGTATGGNTTSTGGAPSNAAGGSATGGNTTTGTGGSHAGNGGTGPSATGGTAGSSTDAGAPSGGAPDEVPPGDYWKPKAGLTWQWQLSEDVATPLKVDVYDIDWEADKASVDKLHAAGIKVICYISVGSWEDFRPDAKDFPAAVIGSDYDGWPGEKYVDIRSAALRQVMSARFDTCKSKGFDAIEPDNMDVFELGGDSGFRLTEADGIAYAKWLADEAHKRGMGIGQKNASSITADIVASYDWALTESCYSDGNWCGDVRPYVTADKPVFMCEYEAASFNAACNAWKPKSYSLILKGLDLDAAVTFCP
jgi:hypothetical protein